MLTVIQRDFWRVNRLLGGLPFVWETPRPHNLFIPFVSFLTSVFVSSSVLSFSLLRLPQDHPAERHLPAERTQHLFSGQRGRVRHVPQVEGQQGQGQRVHRDYQVPPVM